MNSRGTLARYRRLSGSTRIGIWLGVLGIVVTVVMTGVTMKCGSPPAQTTVSVQVPVTIHEPANRSSAPESRPAETAAHWDAGCGQPQDENLLSEEQTITAIRKALYDHDDVASAFCYLAGSGEEAWVRRERNVVFDFCLGHQKLDEAETMVRTWWTGSDAQERRRRVQQLRQKLPRR